MQNASIAVVPMAIAGVAPEAHIRPDKQSNPGHAGTIAATCQGGRIWSRNLRFFARGGTLRQP